MRINLEKGIHGGHLVFDQGEEGIPSLSALLKFGAVHADIPNKIFVFPDVSLSSVLVTHIHQLVEALQLYGIDRIGFVGKNWPIFKEEFHAFTTHYYTDIHDFVDFFPASSLKKYLVFLKYTVDTSFKEMLQHLSPKHSNATLEVNLGAIANNVQIYRKKLSPSTQIMAIVKAAAYGSGDYEIGQFLQNCPIDYLAVAYIEEGVSLRRKEVHLPILVMNPAIDSLYKLIKYDLEPSIYSFRLLEAWQACMSGVQAGPDMHLKLDTGLHRLGFQSQDMPALVNILKKTPALRIKTVFSHLAASGTVQHQAYTHLQAQVFQKLVGYLESHLHRTFCKHLLNTSGMQYFLQYQLDMVRLGIGLYGLSTEDLGLQVAHTLKTTIAQVKWVNPGETIGYDRQGVASRPTQIAVLSIGYADGFSRRLGHGKGVVWIKGQLAPTLGQVCMDMTIVDVTGMEVVEGEEVVVFGPLAPINKMTADRDMISYEILTQINERVKRVYYQEIN